ncbi:MAG: hypothetical protein JJ934_05945 [Pseudomonadales bacterium]|nr:hypothetical protein [Pseudomonadales bacterium]MBO6563953.1 hypothetical protein [Pseudomonadales bacterium]MBO6596048.1 hypothetical protein [Pseudomonadales bacterium]MBO6656413.1 hypothetical protein [Pseudomonadales bacterium]MBO6702668.1 hypothetical protein [Pseudomonadales bacterium]
MPEIMLLGVEEQVLSLEIGDNPADSFPCMPCEGIHTELRTQLYAQLLGIFFDEAESLEQLVLEFGPEGPWVFKLDVNITERLADIEEDDIENIARIWSESGDMEALDLEPGDLIDVLSRFLYNLVHFCMLIRQEQVLSVFIYTE